MLGEVTGQIAERPGTHRAPFRFRHWRCALVHQGQVSRVIHRGVRQRHKLVEYGEFQLQFDAVDHGLEGRFNLVIIGVLHDEQEYIHGDNDDVDPNELHQRLASPSMIYGPQKLNGGVHIDARYDKFLDAEACHLNPLHDVESMNKGGVDLIRSITDIGTVRQHGRWDMQTHGVHDDHDQDRPQ